MSGERVGAHAEPLFADRLAKVSALAERAGVEALVISDPGTMRWLGADDHAGASMMIGGGEGRIVESRDETSAHSRLSLRGWPRISIAARAPVGNDGLHELSRAIATARAVKDAEELELIRSATELVEAAHLAVREELEPGRSELELWDSAAAAIEAEGGERTEAIVDLMVGERTALIGEPPGEAILAAGDPVLFDLAPERHGYWADSCATFVCGAPSDELRERHAAVAAALERGLGCARPGVSAGAVDAAIREQLAVADLECPHHTGHGVGICAQEPPWFVPGSDFMLERGMVVALEPAAYAGGFGVRLEHLAVIEPDGARPLTGHPLTLTGERR